MQTIPKEQLQEIVNSILSKESSKTLSTVLDVCGFLWKVVDKIIETTKNANLTLQQKEDLLVAISLDVVNHLEEKGVLSVELASNSKSLIRSADVFLDVVIGIYNSLPSENKLFQSVFAWCCCFSKKATAGSEPVSEIGKIQVLETPVNESAKVSETPADKSIKVSETPVDKSIKPSNEKPEDN